MDANNPLQQPVIENPQPQILSSKSKLPLVVGVTVVLIVLVGVGTYFLEKQSSKQTLQQFSPTQVPTQAVEPTTNWKRYTNVKFRYELKYPERLNLQEDEYSVVFNIKANNEVDEMPTQLKFYISTIPEQFINNHNQNIVIKNFDEKILNMLLKMKIAERKSAYNETSVLTCNHHTFYKRLQNNSLGMQFDSDEFLENGKECSEKLRRVIVQKGNLIYEIGTYYSTPEELKEFDFLIQTFKFL